MPKLKLTPSADMVPQNLVKVASNLTQAVNNLKKGTKVSDTAHASTQNVIDPPLPAGVASTIDSPNGNGNGETSEPDTADLPIGQRSNKLAQSVSVYYDKARVLGDTKIKGDNSLISLAELAIEGGKNGVFVQEKDGPNYAEELYQRFTQPNSGLKKSRFVDPSEPVNEASFTQQVNKLDWFIKLGWHRGDSGSKFFNEIKDIHEQMGRRKEDRLTLKYRARYEAILSIVRPYMTDWLDDQTTPMPDEGDIRTLLRKDDKQPQTADDYLAVGFKAITAANEGAKANVKLDKPERKGLLDERLTTVLETIRDVMNETPEGAKKYLAMTAPKKKLKTKKGNGATGNGDDNGENGDAPVGSEGPSADAVV